MKYKLLQFLPMDQILVLSDENEFIVFDMNLNSSDDMIEINGVRYGFSHKLSHDEIFEILTNSITVKKL